MYACPLGLNPKPFKYVLGMLKHMSEAAKLPCAGLSIRGRFVSSTSISPLVLMSPFELLVDSGLFAPDDVQAAISIPFRGLAASSPSKVPSPLVH